MDFTEERPLSVAHKWHKGCSPAALQEMPAFHALPKICVQPKDGAEPKTNFMLFLKSIFYSKFVFWIGILTASAVDVKDQPWGLNPELLKSLFSLCLKWE